MIATDTRPLITHVLHHLRIGGMENGLVNLINRLNAAHWRHRVLCVEDYSEFRQRIERHDVEVLALRRSQVGVWGLRRRLYQDFRQHAPAIVHTRNMSGLDALFPAWLARVPARLHSEHGWDTDNLHGENWRPALLRRLHRPLVSRYLTVSKDLARHLRDDLGIAATRIEQIYNGVDPERFRPRQPSDTSPIPAELQVQGAIWVGTAGRMQAVKDQRCLVLAVAELLRQRQDLRPHLRLAMIGDGPLLPALREQVAQAGLGDISWLPGASDRVAEVLRAWDLFVLPSLNEGISNTILEAMASGLPVLATDVGGNPELVEDGTTGALFAAGDSVALAALLARYADDIELRRRQAQAARAHVLQRFSLPAMVEQYGRLYASLLDCRSRIQGGSVQPPSN